MEICLAWVGQHTEARTVKRREKLFGKQHRCHVMFGRNGKAGSTRSRSLPPKCTRSQPEPYVNKKEKDSAMQLNASEWRGEGAVGDDVSREGVFGWVNSREIKREDEGERRLESSMF